MNELWVFHLDKRQWAFLSGDSSLNSPGFYGVKGVPVEENMPKSRLRQSVVLNSYNQVLYIYGGTGYTNTTELGTFNVNVLWKQIIMAQERSATSGCMI